jgi:PhzF family phenazine biosynthesis protein
MPNSFQPNAFQMVDVFCTKAYTGNPVAVVADADDLTTEELQAIACWLNLSETAFLLSATDPAADYRVRIFTLSRELPFAGHPTLGSCHAWLQSGGQPRRGGTIVQQCGVGLVELRHGSDGLSFAAPPLIRTRRPNAAEIDEVLAILQLGHDAVVDVRWIDNGPGWIGVLLKTAADVLAVTPLRHHHRRIEIGVVGPHAPGADADFEVRAVFSGAHGMLIEDPVTGSLNASVGQWLFQTGRAAGRYVAAQGACIGRHGRVEITQDEAGPCLGRRPHQNNVCRRAAVSGKVARWWPRAFQLHAGCKVLSAC